MTDQNLSKDLLQYTKWSGSRADLMALIESLEKADPRARMLQSKKAPYALLPINARRIQWFITKGMMPKPFGHKYGYMHLVYYWASIVARKREKLPFDQIQGLSNAINLDIAQNYIGKNSALLGLMKANDSNEQNFSDASFQEQSKMLQSLGREEGRPLRSELVRFAITPWCHVTINKSQKFRIDPASIDILTKAFKNSLEQILEENANG